MPTTSVSGSSQLAPCTNGTISNASENDETWWHICFQPYAESAIFINLGGSTGSAGGGNKMESRWIGISERSK